MQYESDSGPNIVPLDHTPLAILVSVWAPPGFGQLDALARIAQLVAAQLHSGLSEREIMRRLHGWVLRENE